VLAVKLQGSDITPLLTSGWITPAKVKPAAQLYTWKKFQKLLSNLSIISAV
jgi:hypothetical protein